MFNSCNRWCCTHTHTHTHGYNLVKTEGVKYTSLLIVRKKREVI